jgi:hypothetical protein
MPLSANLGFMLRKKFEEADDLIKNEKLKIKRSESFFIE